MTTRALAAAMVGREAQYRELDEALARARSGAGQVVLVSGEAGVGKSRLLREFAARLAAAPDVEVLRGNCFDEDPAEPYAPFVEVLRGLVQSRSPEAVSGAAGPWASDLARLLPDLDAPAAPRAADAADLASERRRLFEAIARVVRPPQADCCRVVLIEDIHWADQASQDLIHYLARAAERDRLLLIATYRADELHRRHPLTHLIARLSRDRLSTEVRLAPLSRAELGQMLDAALARPLPQPFVDALFERTEGNPFFAEDVIGALAASGRLDALVDASRSGRITDLPTTPVSVKDSILRRTVGLDETTLGVLRYAAVVGRRFDFELLLRVTGLGEGDLLAALARLVDQRLVAEEADAAEDRYRFRHELVREAVLEDLLRRDRRNKHREVLLALERMAGEQVEPLVDQLAYHSAQARDRARASRYGALAGDRAAALCAYREALAHYEAALEADEDASPAHRAELLRRMGDAAYPLGDVRRCAALWGEARPLFEQAGDRRSAADMSRWLGRAAWELGDVAGAFAHTRAALAALEGETPCHELAMAYSALSHLHMLTDAYEDGIAWAEKALALAEDLGDVGVRAHALNNIGTSLCGLGDYDRGLAALEQSLQIARGAGLHLDAVRAYINLGGQIAQVGELRRAAALIREGVAYAERYGWDLRVATLLPKLAWVELLLGDLDAAQARLDQARRAAHQSSADDRLYIQLIQADILMRRGQFDAARSLAEAMQPRPAALRDCMEAINVAQLRAGLAAAQGDLRRAAEHVADAARAWEVGGRPPRAVYGVADALEILAQAGRLDEARGIYVAVEEVLRGTPLTLFARACLAEVRGVMFGAEGRQEAAAHFREAAESWRAVEVPLEEAGARRRLAAELLRRGGADAREEARRELSEARAIAERIGAQPELARVSALLREAGTTRQTARGEILTPREREVLGLLARGASNRAIAEALIISEKTVEVHVSNILGKLGATSRTHAAALARAQGYAEAA